MRRSLVLAIAVTLCSVAAAQAQVGMPGIEYANTVAGGDGVQLYPYDQQDPWLHGYYQRYPAYGGFASFRPYNYRHVFSQTQIASGWGSAHGMPYSQQFWNKYRSSYLDENLHSQADSIPFSSSVPAEPQPLIHRRGMPVYPTSTVRPIGYQPSTNQAFGPAAGRPIHIFPEH